jgi:adenosylhomocysteine nucleosidase
VARAALAAGLPFLIVRAIADPAGRALPTAVIGMAGPEGRIRAGRVLGAVARRPSLVPSFARLAADMARAGASLRQAAAILQSEPPFP